MSASSIATNANLVSGLVVASRSSSTMSPDDVSTVASVIQLDNAEGKNDRRSLVSDKSSMAVDDRVDTILVHPKNPEPITLPKPSLISTTLGSSSVCAEETKSWPLTLPSIKISSTTTTLDVKSQLKSISNIVQSGKTPNCSSSSKVSPSNSQIKETISDIMVTATGPKATSNTKSSPKSHFKDPNIIKSSSGHHHNNGFITKPLVINHSTSVDKITTNHNDYQPIISTLSSQLIFSSIITTQAKSLSSVQVPRATTQQQQQQQLNSSPTKTTLVMSNRLASPASSPTSSSSSSSISVATTTTPTTTKTTSTSEFVNNNNKSQKLNLVAFPSSTNTGQAVSARLMDMGKKLLDAAREGHTDHVRQLVVNSGAPFTSDWLGTTALHLAAQNGHAEIAEILLRGGVNRDARTKLERTALHLAAQGGWIEVVDLLLIHGSDVNVRDMLKMTPLHWAVERCHVAVVERLLFSGADASAKSKFHLTPIDIAQNSQSYEIMDLFRNWIHKSGNNIVSYVGLNNNNLSESHEVLDLDYHHLNLDASCATTNRNSMLDIDEPCIDLVELEWSALKFEPEFFLPNDDEDEPKVEYLMKVVEELQKENRQLRRRVEQLSTTSQ